MEKEPSSLWSRVEFPQVFVLLKSLRDEVGDEMSGDEDDDDSLGMGLSDEEDLAMGLSDDDDELNMREKVSSSIDDEYNGNSSSDQISSNDDDDISSDDDYAPVTKARKMSTSQNQQKSPKLPKTNNNYSCGQCDEKFRSAFHVNEHRMKEHSVG